MTARTPDSVIGSVLRHNINRHLVRLGWSAVDLYTQLNISRTQYSRWFKHPAGPRLGFVWDAAGALGCRPSDLLETQGVKVPRR